MKPKPYTVYEQVLMALMGADAPKKAVLEAFRAAADFVHTEKRVATDVIDFGGAAQRCYLTSSKDGNYIDPR